MVLMLLIAAEGFCQQPISKDRLLDKKTFLITLTKKASKKVESFDDEISFRSGKMGSRKLQTEDGFIKGEYIVTGTVDMDEDKVIRFQGINKNAKDRSLKWEGTVFGESIEGTATVSKNGKIKEEYFFAGKLKQRGKQRK